MKIYKPKTIQEAIDSLQTFLESDMWYSFNNEIESEEDMIKYLEEHFDILNKQIKELELKKNIKTKKGLGRTYGY